MWHAASLFSGLATAEEAAADGAEAGAVEASCGAEQWHRLSLALLK